MVFYPSNSPIALFNFFSLNTLTLKYFMYLIDHVAELRFVNRLIYAIKQIYTSWLTVSGEIGNLILGQVPHQQTGNLFVSVDE